MRWFLKFLKVWTSKNLRDQNHATQLFSKITISNLTCCHEHSWIENFHELPSNFRSIVHITNKNKMIMLFATRYFHWLLMDKFSQLIFHADTQLMSQLLIAWVQLCHLPLQILETKRLNLDWFDTRILIIRNFQGTVELLSIQFGISNWGWLVLKVTLKLQFESFRIKTVKSTPLTISRDEPIVHMAAIMPNAENRDKFILIEKCWTDQQVLLQDFGCSKSELRKVISKNLIQISKTSTSVSNFQSSKSDESFSSEHDLF